MDLPTHTFPVPATEAEKLAEIGRKLAHHKVEDWVRAHPWPSVLIAFALGLLIRKIIR
jgi:ElaB/YqjD/DUF883 family membrane-anchored ribosome-binding protein